MNAAVPTIASRMTQIGMTMQNTAPDILIRDALFRLWRTVIPSGDIVDHLFRDPQEDKIKPKVKAQITPQTTLEQLVALTMNATAAFGRSLPVP
jgi:hypothetical protein